MSDSQPCDYYLILFGGLEEGVEHKSWLFVDVPQRETIFIHLNVNPDLLAGNSGPFAKHRPALSEGWLDISFEEKSQGFKD